MLMNKSQSDSAWKKIQCCLVATCNSDVGRKFFYCTYRLKRQSLTPGVHFFSLSSQHNPNFSKDEYSGKRKFQNLSSLSYIRRTYLKLPILFYHERPKHRNILADHWIILFPTLWNIQHSHLSRTVKIFKIIFKAVLGPYKCSWCTSGSLSWTDVRTSSKVPGGWSGFSNQAAILGSRRRHLRQTAE